MKMTPKAYIDALIDKGAVITICGETYDGTPSYEFLLAALAWQDNPLRVKWCAVFPEDQHHVHETPYATVTLDHGIYAVFRNKAGYIVAQVSALDESDLDLTAAQKTLSAWQDLLERYDNKKKFERFFEEN